MKGDGKDEGPQGLRTVWAKQGFSKTQAVVLELMTRMPNQGKGHAVHLDNLFTSSKLLTTLRQYGIGAAGTVRTGQTRREVNNDKRQRAQSLHESAQDDTEDDTEDDTQDEDLDLDLDQDPHSFNDPNVQQQLDLLNKVIQDLNQSRNPQAQCRNPLPLPHLLPHSQGRKTRAKRPEKEKNFGMNEKLMELKTKWSNHIAWGELYGCLSSN